jgi:hypothetical protein
MASDKVLRIGVVQGVTVIEERLVRVKGAVSFGTAPNNTFVLSGSDLPKSVVLFEPKGDGYELVFGEDAQGQLERDGQGNPIKLEELKATAQKQGDTYRLDLPDTARGRVKLGGEIMVLWHFVPEPPAVAGPTLPSDMRGGFIGQIEPIFTAVLLASFLFHAAIGIYVNVVEPPQAPELEDLRRIVETMVPPKVEAQKIAVNIESVVQTGPGAGTEVPQGEGGGGGGGGGKGRGGGGVGDRDALREQIAGRGILQLIGGRGGAGGGGAVGSVFGAGSSISDDIGSALAGTAGVGIAGAGGGDGVTRRGEGGGGAGGGCGGGCGGAADIGVLATGGGGPIDTGEKRAARIVARVRADDVEAVDGRVDKKGVAATIRRRQDAFQSCYENALKANSKLQGKLVVEFTIGDGGKVTDARVVRDGLGSAEVAGCVLATLKRIRFPSPADGEVTISNSFVFQPGG